MCGARTQGGPHSALLGLAREGSRAKTEPLLPPWGKSQDSRRDNLARAMTPRGPFSSTRRRGLNNNHKSQLRSEGTVPPSPAGSDSHSTHPDPHPVAPASSPRGSGSRRGNHAHRAAGRSLATSPGDLGERGALAYHPVSPQTGSPQQG